VQPEEDIS
jgi:tRNA-2-methylthio-N6-dimethylallyladenosine synthase